MQLKTMQIPKLQKFAALVLFAAAFAGASLAQETVQEYPEALLGSFEGPLVIGRDNMNLAFTFSLRDEELRAALTSGSMGIYGMPATSVELRGNNVTIKIPRLDVEFNGTLRFDESGDSITRIDGDWFQYAELVPVVLLPVDEPTF